MRNLLYHFTNNCTTKMWCNYKEGLSLTRNSRLNFRDYKYVIVIDRDKLRNRFKIECFDYAGYAQLKVEIPEKWMLDEFRKEAEERVYPHSPGYKLWLQNHNSSIQDVMAGEYIDISFAVVNIMEVK